MIEREDVEALADALHAAWRDGWANKPNDTTLHGLATALIDSGAITVRLTEEE